MSKDTEHTSLKQKLGRLRPRDTAYARAHSASYTRIVDRLRWILPIVVLIGLGLLLAWPMWQNNQISAVLIDNVPNLMVEKLNLTGLDERNQPYSLTAERALQAINTKNLVDLQKPKGELTLQSGAWMAGHADAGRLDQAAKKLWLGGNVELFHDDGYRFTTDEMNVDLGKSAAWGAKPVVLQGKFGEIEGGGFRLLDGGKAVVITGPARAKLQLRAQRGSDKPNINHSQAR